MAKEQNDFRAAENVEPYWTNSALGNADLSIRANYPYDYIGAIDDALIFTAQLIIYFILLGFTVYYWF
jgi:hypothetical protein